MNIGVDGYRLIVEILSTLVHIKTTMAELILKPAGVPLEAYSDLFYKRDDTTGRTLSKRKIAPLILERIQATENSYSALRSIIEIASRWNSFHLAENEFTARGTVQKAREFLGVLETMEAREAEEHERVRNETIARTKRDRAEIFRKELELLLLMFEELTLSDEPHKRGFLLQDLLNRLFDLHEIPVHKSFQRNDGAEQIDGGFSLEGWHYIVECRWRQKLADIRELDGFNGQVVRSGKQGMGLFLSINGWSEHVPQMLKQNPDKSIILMEGFDLRCVLSGQIDLKKFLLKKAFNLTMHTEPYYSAKQYLQEHSE